MGSEGYIGLSLARKRSTDTIFEEDLQVGIEPELDGVEYDPHWDDNMVIIRFADGDREATAALMMDEGHARDLVDRITHLLEEADDG